MTDPNPFKPVDPLGEALHYLRMSGMFYSRCEFTAPFGLVLPSFKGSMMFHVVTAGRCRVEVDKANACMLGPGDLALVPHAQGHRLVSEPGVPAARLFSLPRELASDRFETLRHGGGGAAATVICGVVKVDHPAAHHLIRLLPKVISFNARNSPETEWIESTLRFMAAEAKEMRPGGEAVITRLADILVIQAIRYWIARDPAAQTGWLSALRDEQIGKAIALIHRDPGRNWTLAALANTVGMSRSVFAARFTELVGEPAMRYATRWKMHAAYLLLAQGGVPLRKLAAKFGYDSRAAFSRAFKRFNGVSPEAARRRSIAQ